MSNKQAEFYARLGFDNGYACSSPCVNIISFLDLYFYIYAGGGGWGEGSKKVIKSIYSVHLYHIFSPEERTMFCHFKKEMDRLKVKKNVFIIIKIFPFSPLHSQISLPSSMVPLAHS